MALLLTSSASPPPPPPSPALPSDLAAGRNYLCFWSFYQTARGFPKHLEQLMELEWSVTLRVETGSWKQRHPVGLMLESGTWEELSSNPHSTCEGNDLEKFQQDPLHTPACLWVLLPRDQAWRRSHQCSPYEHGNVAHAVKGSVAVLVSQTQNMLLCPGWGRSRGKPVFCKGQ